MPFECFNNSFIEVKLWHSVLFSDVHMFLFFSGMDCKSSNNANKKLIQGKYIIYFLFLRIYTLLKDYL